MATRNAISRKSYRYQDGTTSRSAKAGWTALVFELFDGRDAEGKGIVAGTIEFPKAELGSEVLECAMGHGLSQKLGDELAGIEAKRTKAAENGEAFETAAEFASYLLTNMWDNLKSGVWVEEGEGGGAAGNVTLLFEAILAAFEKAGKPISEDKHPTLRKHLEDKTYRDDARSNPHVKAELSRIVAERAAERAKAAKAAAKTAAADLSGFGLEDEAAA